MRNWIKTCFILHNLCIIFEGDDRDNEGRRQLIQAGKNATQDADGLGDGIGQGGAAGGTDGAAGAADPCRALMQVMGLI